MNSHLPWSDTAMTMSRRSPGRHLGSDAFVQRVLELACLVSGCTREQLVAPDRTGWMVNVRAAAYTTLRVLTNGKLSYPAIGRVFDRDHTTVMHAVQRISAVGEELAEEIIEAYEAKYAAAPHLRVVGR